MSDSNTPEYWMDRLRDVQIERDVLRDSLAARDREIAELKAVERCEHCGSDRIYHGPPDCPTCGAPNCCQVCCKIAEQGKEIERLREAALDKDIDRMAFQGLHAYDLTQINIKMKDQAKRIAELEKKVDALIGAAEPAIEVLDNCGCDVEAGRLQNAINWPATEAKPDPIQAVYERFKHMDRILGEINDDDDVFSKTAHALWQAVKAKIEGE